MKRPAIYLKMKFLGAIYIAPGKTRDECALNVAATFFLDEEGDPLQST